MKKMLLQMTSVSLQPVPSLCIFRLTREYSGLTCLTISLLVINFMTKHSPRVNCEDDSNSGALDNMQCFLSD
jgi:hypothetical protein